MNDTGERALIIVPTYNESDNIELLTERVGELEAPGVSLDMLVVDDASPDGTGDIADSLVGKSVIAHVLHRPGKLGLGSAYLDGFKWALENGYDYIFEMDADFSHDPSEVPNFLRMIADYDLVLGSRYIKGITVVNWPLSRLLLSYAGNWYARWVTGIPLRDLTGGYKCFRRSVLEAIDLDTVSSEGYSFQVEMNARAWHGGFKIHEVPIVFRDRTRGESKMNWQINREAAWMVWKLKWQAWRGRM
ncbi:MAG: polyprenol monophosphomannose synthase [Candidatus Latescibacteria bacterium]|nr:polyprenol monophosphomannose synthase [Candidatus Latescibacterota bacterium]